MLENNNSGAQLCWMSNTGYMFLEIAKAFEEKGYKIANCIGITEYPLDKTHVGILKPQKSTKRKSMFGLLKLRTRALFIGVLWLNNEARGAKVGKQWVLEVYGKDYIKELTKVVKKIADRYNVNVVVNLESKEPYFERFYSEFMICV